MMLLSSLLLQYVFAIEPMNPVAMCEQRMIHAEEKKQCEKQAKNLKLDWYAATACNALNDDKKFMGCLKSVAGGIFNPEALGRCVEGSDDSDDTILKCILTLKDKRMPASVKGGFQTLKVPNKKHQNKQPKKQSPK